MLILQVSCRMSKAYSTCGNDVQYLRCASKIERRVDGSMTVSKKKVWNSMQVGMDSVYYKIC
jgi:hypothetical protein